MKSFKNLKQIKNRDEYVKVCEINYANSLLDMIEINEEIVSFLPTEIINPNLENKFTDLRCLTKSGKIMILEGNTLILTHDDLDRYYGYFKDTTCEFSKEIIFIILCLSKGNNIKYINAERHVCFKPLVVELKNIDGKEHLKRLKTKFKNNEMLNHKDCSFLVHLPLLSLPISEDEYVREICGYIKKYPCIPEYEKYNIIPAMYLNIHYFIDSEYEQEKLLEDVNMLKYCETAYDRKIREAREDEAAKVTKAVTKDVTKKVTEDVTKRVTKDVSESIACNLLRVNSDINYVHEITIVIDIKNDKY